MSELTVAQASDMVVDIVDNGGADNYTINELVALLELADHMYYNEQPIMTDADYDGIRLFATRLAPHHVYFTGVGSEVRGGKIKLPYQMGSLDQVEIGEIADWVGEWSLQDQYMIITDKLDGTSAMVIYDETGDLQIAYSRGNGVEGADITRHIKHIVPANIGGPAVIRGEVIIPKYHFEAARDVAKSRGGSEYRNARNMVAGLMNAKTNNEEIYKYISFVGYEIVDYDGIDKINMLRDLQKMGSEIPVFTTKLGKELTDGELAAYLNVRRSYTEYEIDGLVIDVNFATKRKQMNPTRDTLNPSYSVKYKVADANNYAEAEVVGIEWGVSKHGYLKPRINIKPVELVGVTVQYCTGFNAKFIYDNKIQPGTVIAITRSGDVVPYCTKVISSGPLVVHMSDPKSYDEWFTNQLNQIGPWEWNETEVDAVLINYHDNEEVIINRLVDFFTSVDAPFLKKGNIVKLVDYNQFDTTAIIRLPERMFISILGENGKKVYAGLRKALTNIPLWKLMGSTHFFGRGVGKRKMKKLIDALGHRKVFTGIAAEFARVEGFDEKTARKVEDGMDAFLEWFGPLEDDGFITVDYSTSTDTNGKLKDQKIVFTGFRDKELQALAEANGAAMQSSVSGKTTILVAADPDSNSGKLKKARESGVRVMGIDEFKKMME
jgi:NAD-dependent DNA ligase